MIYENRDDDATLLRLFHHPIRYAQASNHFSLPAQLLARPVVRSYRRLVELLGVFPFDLMQGPAGQNGFAEAIEQLILGQLARGEPIPTVAQFANAFNTSSATLRRRLAEENVTLGTIKERCRHQLAIELLAQEPRLKIADVAQRLGFSDARAFRRAFRTWSSESPEAYRLTRGATASV